MKRKTAREILAESFRELAAVFEDCLQMSAEELRQLRGLLNKAMHSMEMRERI